MFINLNDIICECSIAMCGKENKFVVYYIVLQNVSLYNFITILRSLRKLTFGESRELITWSHQT